MSEEEIQVIKTALCPSLSERSTLTYEIGCKGNAIFLRISGNTGSGIFSKDWIPLSHIASTEDETPITAKKLRDIFKGKSVNTVGFLMAALIAEGLLKISENSLRSYDRIDPAEFNKTIQVFLNCDIEKPPLKSIKTLKIQQ